MIQTSDPQVDVSANIEEVTDFLTPDYLTPEQRIAAIAEILATGALRILKERHEQDTP